MIDLAPKQGPLPAGRFPIWVPTLSAITGSGRAQIWPTPKTAKAEMPEPRLAGVGPAPERRQAGTPSVI